MQNKRGKKSRGSSKKKNNKALRALKYIFVYIPLTFFVISIFSILVLKWVPVYCTPLMVIRSIENISDGSYTTYKTWKPLEKISPNMQIAAIAAEDNRFEDHWGFDFEAIDKAIKHNKHSKRMRGASTISQQTAKNVFLYPSRSWIRKGLEAYFTLGIELIWGKERIMEVYLNVAEMGRGVFGSEAAANQFFQKSAQKLTSRESALIVACLPNPSKRRADHPSGYLSARASHIQMLMGMVDRPEWLKKSKRVDR